MGQHLDHLERFYDGAVPAHLRAWARRQDAAEAVAAAPLYAPPAPLPIAPRRARCCIPLMARLLTDRAAATDACTEADLACAGFTGAEIALHGEAARALATRIMADRAP